MRRIIQKGNLRSSKISRTQRNGDTIQRIFCCWILRKLQRDPHFLERIQNDSLKWGYLNSIFSNCDCKGCVLLSLVLMHGHRVHWISQWILLWGKLKQTSLQWISNYVVTIDSEIIERSLHSLVIRFKQCIIVEEQHFEQLLYIMTIITLKKINITLNIVWLNLLEYFNTILLAKISDFNRDKFIRKT